MLGHLKWPQSLKSLSVAVDKGKITLCFDRGALTYDSVGFAQKKASSHLVRMIRKALPQQTRNIADIGCGSLNDAVAGDFDKYSNLRSLPNRL